MQLFINEKNNVVTEAIDGLIQGASGKLSRLDGYPHIKVVVRSDWDKSRVALISGGGSGHEPSHAGFVGRGMLTAAVCGDVFASPSVDAVLAAILAVTGPQGCLLIVKNYTGDRLNFGLAAERARSLGLKVSMVVVDDDIALPDIPQPRGLAGTLFIHKIAGAMAEEGASLETVTVVTERIISKVKTIGLSLDTCLVPGSEKIDRIPDGRAELGLGIHGEAGIEQINYSGVKAAVSVMIDKLTQSVGQGDLVVLINNLGGVSSLEMSIITNEIFSSSLNQRLSWVIGPSCLMTSLDMKGFSITVCPVTDEALRYLNTPVEPWSWPGCNSITAPQIIEMPDGLRPEPPVPSAHPATKDLILGCCEVLIDCERELNTLDAFSGDGDTGSTLASAARSLISKLDELPLADHTQLFRAMGQELSQTMGGSSGVLLAIFFAAAGDSSSSGSDIPNSLLDGLKRMKEIGGAELGDRSMVDALEPALNAFARAEDPAMASRKGAEETAKMISARVGRATYLSADQLQGNKDPGAEAVAKLFEYLVGRGGS